jgi:hypothetical protein
LYKDILEQVIAHFTGERYAAEFVAAREEYFRRTGKVFEDEPMFESRITACLEWYLFDRVLENYGVPPVRLYLLIHRSGLTAENLRVLEGLQKTRHSLFEYLGRVGQRFRVQDLMDDRVYDITERRAYAGIRKGDLLDARLLFKETEALFSDAMWLHPVEARKFILDEVEKARETKGPGREGLLFDLAYMKLKQDRYHHLSTLEIYNWNNFRRDRDVGGG